MKNWLRLSGYLLAVFLLFTGLTALAGWWIFRRSLPQLDGTISLPELRQEVIVDRDLWGVPHLRAQQLEDLLLAQGYVVAQDRLWQMDFLRRVAAGELSEVFGPVTLELDRENRTLGLRAAAEHEAAEMEPETRWMLEAYAQGVNRYIHERRGNLPAEFVLLRYAPRPWTPMDTLLVGGYMYKVLTTTWKWELSRSKVVERVGPERARELFVEGSRLDHFIVGDPARNHAKTGLKAPSKRLPVDVGAILAAPLDVDSLRSPQGESPAPKRTNGELGFERPHNFSPRKRDGWPIRIGSGRRVA